jgi:hypothetical protein
MPQRDDTAVPEGLDFINLVARQERTCEEETRTLGASLGEKAPKCLIALGTALSLIDRLASCWWGCAGGDHVVEYLVGRSVASARGSLRLSFGGYYDESLGLTRSVGEIANLLALFAADTSTLTTWRAASRRQRRNDFGPAAARRRLMVLGAPHPISKERYAALCELATHVTPETRPQAHNPLQMPIVGAHFQRTGYMLALNELAIPVAFVGLFGSSLLKADETIRGRFVLAGRALAEAIGRVNVLDGYPRLNTETIDEIVRLVGTVSPDDQPFLRQAILRMAEEGPIEATGEGDPKKAKG